MTMSAKELIGAGFKVIGLFFLCSIIADVTQVAAMVIIVGAHELGHALTGMVNGEQLAKLPSVSLTGPLPYDVRGLTKFVDSSMGTMSRVFAGPFTNLMIGVVLALVLALKTKSTKYLKNGPYAGFIVEALTILLFWSGFAIVSQFIRSPGTDLAGAVPTNLIGQSFLLLAVLFGMSIMTSLTFDRFIKYFFALKIVQRNSIERLKRRAWVEYTVYLAFSVLVTITVPDVAAFLLVWLFMIATAAYYTLLLIDNRRNYCPAEHSAPVG